jgi:apolipoprotein N-acyltransferase
MRKIAAFLYLTHTLGVMSLCFFGPYRMEDLGPGDLPYFVLLSFHILWAVYLLLPLGRQTRRCVIWFMRMPEVLFGLSLLLFLFSYIYALNANMDYVQRFIATGGNLRLAQDTSVERRLSLIRYGPVLSADLIVYLLPRLFYGRRLRELWKGQSSLLTGSWSAGIQTWAFPMILTSASLTALSFPSFLSLDGMEPLAYLGLVPLFIVLSVVSYGWGLFYGVCFGVFTNLIVNYWLGPYSLVSLQVTIIVFFLLYLLFMVPALWLYRRIRRLRFLVLPLAWVVFDYLRSTGFFGYPWGLIGTTQYRFLPLIQMASITGVWGVSFVVILINSAFSETILNLARLHNPAFETTTAPAAALGETNRNPLGPLYVSLSFFLICLLLGSVFLALDVYESPCLPPRSVRVALIQQNSDPRKHEYERTFSTLRSLTDQALADSPDLIAWSETAFVPNIRRWSREDPKVYRLAGLVREFLAYQRSIRSWLLTGNDDYDLLVDESGEQKRLDYNAAVLLSPEGERVATYHKVHLVPFTEYFPYKKALPGIYNLLLAFDVTFWEPGKERMIFRHPLFCFCTPICFEDTFPMDMREFILNGAELILNLSNDYWSLTEVEAKQHFIGSLFRAVENRRPLLRSTASGYTAYVDSAGRLIEGLPFYEEGYFVADVEVQRAGLTVYTRFGDWFPLTALAGLFALLMISLLRPHRR